MNPCKIAVSMLLIFLTIEASSQVVLNGDFEDNTAASCLTNLPNTQYTNTMNNSWGFGSSDELDIQNNSCGFATAPSKNWFVSLSKPGVGYHDALSLKISTPLTMGDVYDLSYLEFGADTFDANNIPLEVGLSMDSLSFGDLIHSSTPPVNVWALQSVSFTAPNNGQYLTVRIDSEGVLRGWNFVDKFELSITTGLTDVSNLNAKVYPNPAQEEVTIESDFQMNNIRIYDFIGKEVLSVNCNKASTIQLNVLNLATGYYMLNIQGDNDKSKMIKLCKM